ncbi:MAG: DUF5615 family PIN-like protein [Phycisphaeraceae bacterium]|nr:DUF5615 family PIN-like protein [Phycisphaeraceae bacterium]
MKVLLDTCVWGGVRAALTQLGHEVEWVGDRGRDPGDEVIIAYAHERSMVLVTLDKDFGELAIVRGMPHKGIVRLIGLRAKEQGPVCAAVLEKYEDELASGAILTVDATRVRVRPADVNDD